MFQYMLSANVCQVLIFANEILCEGVPRNVRYYRACQHMIGECYAMLGHAKMCLGILIIARCSRYKNVQGTKTFQDMRGAKECYCIVPKHVKVYHEC